MKKRAAFCVGLAVLTALAGCGAAGRRAGEPLSSPVSGAESSSQAGKISASAAGTSSQAATPSGMVSAASSAAAPEPGGTYYAKTVSARYLENGNRLTAEYPQLAGSGRDYSAVNAQLEKEALGTIDRVRAGGESAGITADTAGRVEFCSPDFVSVVFESSFKTPANAHTFRALRTVNYDLRAKKAATRKDLIVKNDVLCKAAEAAVKKQLSKEAQEYFTPQVLRDGIDQAELYFQKDRVVLSFTVPYDLDDHAEISLGYGDTAGFRTGNAVWGYLLKA